MNPVAGLVVESLDDFDRVIDGVTPERAVENPTGQSSIAWTLGHVTEHLDRLINHTVLGHDRQAVLGVDRFRMGSAGEADDWEAIRAATEEVRAVARPLLESVTEEDLAREYDFPGAITQALGGALPLRYALLRIASHHYFHIGVIACQRDLRGESVGDYPGLLRAIV